MVRSAIEQRLEELTAEFEQHRLVVNRDISLRQCRWRPARVRARVLLLTGRGGFLEKYYPVVIKLLERGLETISFDWRGQGLSTRPLDNPQIGHVNDFSDYLFDLECVTAAFFDSPPAWNDCYLLAHSMGAHVALRWLAEKHPGERLFRHAWLTAPLVGVNTRPYPLPLARLIVGMAILLGGREKYVPGGKGFNADRYRQEGLADLCSDPQQVAYEVACLQAEPALQLGSPSYGWLQAAFRSIQALLRPAYLERISQPVTQFLAEQESVVDVAACQRLQLRLPDCRTVRVPAARHDLLVEAESLQQPIWQQIDDQLSVDLGSAD